MSMSDLERQDEVEAAEHSPLSYNIGGSLGGIGRGILLQTIHEMKEGKDIQELLSCSRTCRDVFSEPLYKWSISQTLAEIYQLKTIPFEQTDPVRLYVLFTFILFFF